MALRPALPVLLAGAALMSACAGTPVQPVAPAAPVQTEMSAIAESYVRMVLALGERDPGYVDAYYGPAEWQDQAHGRMASLDEIRDTAVELSDRLQRLPPVADPLERQRRRFLGKHLGALAARAAMIEGHTFRFDAEARALYDFEPPQHDEAFYQAILDRLERLVPPGAGTLTERYERYLQQFEIPKDRIQTVVQAAIDEARRRTLLHLALPGGEHFELELVTGNSWSAYNWYKGKAYSLIQVDTTLPVYLPSAIRLAAHEGYPGHHVYNALLEQHLVKERGWIEFTVYPLFSPMSLLAEGTAEAGVDMVFPDVERLAFERDVLFPLAGLDPAQAEQYFRIREEARELAWASIDAARGLLDGQRDAEQTAAWLSRYGLVPLEQAQKSVRFAQTYRSYVINYAAGRKLVEDWLDRNGGDTPATRWAAFGKLLSEPLTPTDLIDKEY
ncbi:MAG TPA: hypothetical protein VM074_08835 [Solimonas sp.]|nr:hypothetical protein [Solimonas sp.]